MAASVGNTGGTTTNGASFTNNGFKLVVLVATANGATQDITSVTFGGVSLTAAVEQRHTVGNRIDIGIWYLDNAAQGSGAVTLGGTLGSLHIIPVSVNGAASGGPQSTYKEELDSTSHSCTLNPTTIGGIAFDMALYHIGVGDGNIGHGGSETEISEVDNGYNDSSGAYRLVVGTTTDMSTTEYAFGPPWSVYCAAAWAPAPAAGGAVWMFNKMRDLTNDLKAGLIPPDQLRRKYREVYSI